MPCCGGLKQGRLQSGGGRTLRPWRARITATSRVRFARYPDLTVHRLLHQWITTGPGGFCDPRRVGGIGRARHSSNKPSAALKKKRKRELIKLKNSHVHEHACRIGNGKRLSRGSPTTAFLRPRRSTCRSKAWCNVSTLDDDYYYFDERPAMSPTRAARGQRRLFRPGRSVCKWRVIRVDLQRRQNGFSRRTQETGSSEIAVFERMPMAVASFNPKPTATGGSGTL